MAPPAGAFVEVKAQLEPPLQPLRPGGYDFARDLYFQRIGASGFVRGAVKIVTPPAAPGAWLTLGAYVQGVRDAIDGRIRSVLAGDPGAIASAVITGKRDAISPAVYDAMFVSGIGHVLSISGYHMAVVAGIVFFVVRAILALIPGLADRAPIKKWAALAALIVTAFYLVLSGAEVATQRSFIMIAIVLIGVMLDRPILTLRTVTIAALLVLLFAPEAIVHPSFQMSFAATLALVAGYERGLSWARAGADSSLGARAALWGVREVASVILASLLAGLATTPYAAYHFHRLAPYGVLANLLAMPIVSVWVMPMGILGVVAIPFGFDAEFWRQMGHGIDWMDAVALWVASLPGAFGRVTAFGTGPLLLGTAGLLVIGLLKTPLRWTGVAIMLVARDLGGAYAGAGHPRRRRRPHLRGARRGRPARLPSHRRRHFCDARVACRRRGRPRRSRSEPRQRHRLRPIRLHRQARRWPAGLPRARPRCAGGGLRARRPHRDRARHAARLRRHGGRSRSVAHPRCFDAPPQWLRLRDGGGTAAELRSPLGPGAIAATFSAGEPGFRCRHRARGSAAAAT
jgi:ComEC/Rec2-related protein